MPRNTSHSIVNIIDLIGEGPIEGFPTANKYKHIYLDDTPLSTSAGTYIEEDINFEFRNGTVNQAPLTGSYGNVGQVVNFDSTNVLSPEQVSASAGEALTLGTSNNPGPAWGYGINNPLTYAECSIKIRDDSDVSSITLVDNIGVTVAWPEGCYRTDSNEGVLKAQDCRLRISLCPNPSSSNPIWIVRIGDIPGGATVVQDAKNNRTNLSLGLYVDNSMEPVQRTFKLQIPPSWLSKGGSGIAESTIKVRLACIYGYSGKLIHSVIQPVSVTTYLKNNQNYPYSALAGITITSDQYSSVPKRAYDLRLLKVRVPSNYNIWIDSITGEVTERKYTGIWDGTFKVAWSDNPAWAYYDLLTNKRYGVGKYLDPNLIDKWELYKIAQYCDGVVPTSDNWDIYLQRYDSSGVATGSNTQVNTATSVGVQTLPTSILLSDNNILIVWNNYNSTNTSYNAVGKIISSTGTTVVADFNIQSNSSIESIVAVDVVALSGSFVVVLRGQKVNNGIIETNSTKLYTKAFTNAGVASALTLVENIRSVSADKDATYSNPSITNCGTGYVITYAARSKSDFNCYFRIYSSAGALVKGRTRINTITIGEQNNPQVSTLSNGNFVVAYTSDDKSSTSISDIFGRIYTSAGTPVTDEITLLSSVAGSIFSYISPRVTALSSGGFALASAKLSVLENNIDPINVEDKTSIVTKVFNSSGVATSNEVLVSTLTSSDTLIGYQFPNIVEYSGGYIITWSTIVEPTLGGDKNYDVYHQRFTSAGVAQGSNTRVHSSSTLNEVFSTVYKISTGGYGIAYAKSNGVSSSGIKLFRTRNGGENRVGDAVGGVRKSYSISLSENEPRYTCNIVINTREEAYTLIRTMASIFRGITYFQNSTLITRQDAPQDPNNPSSVTPDLIFNNTNVIDGTFEYSSTSQKARHSVALVSYTDAIDNYREKVEYVEFKDAIDRYGYRPLEIRAAGCTTRGQAHRVGLWSLITENQETDTVTFTTGLEGAIAYPGAIIGIRDSNRSSSRKGGRVVSSTSNTITIDSRITISTLTNQKLYVQINTNQTETLPNGTTRQTLRPTIAVKNVNNVVNSDVITITDTWATLPSKGAVWFLTDDSDLDRFFRILSVEQTNFNTYSITAVNFNKDKYTAVDNGEYLTIPNVPLSTRKPMPPKSVTLSHDYVPISTGGVEVYLKITWTPDRLATSNQGYRVLLKSEDNDDNYILNSEYSAKELPNVYYGTNNAVLKITWNEGKTRSIYKAKVVPTDMYGKISANEYATVSGTESANYIVKALVMPPLLTSSDKTKITIDTISNTDSIDIKIGDGDGDLVEKYTWQVYAKNDTLYKNTPFIKNINTYTIGAITDDGEVTLNSYGAGSAFNSDNFVLLKEYVELKNPLDGSLVSDTLNNHLSYFRAEVNLGTVTGFAQAGTTTTKIINTAQDFKVIPIGAAVTVGANTSYVVSRTNYNKTTKKYEAIVISPAITGLTSGSEYFIKEAIYSSPIVALSTVDKNRVKLNETYLLEVGGTLTIKLYNGINIHSNKFDTVISHTGLNKATTYRYYIRAASGARVSDWLPSNTGIADTTSVSSESKPSYVVPVNKNPFFVSYSTTTPLYPIFWSKSRTTTNNSLGYVTNSEPWELKILTGEAINTAFEVTSTPGGELTKYVIYVRAKSSIAETGSWRLRVYEKSSLLSTDKSGLYSTDFPVEDSNNVGWYEVATSEQLLVDSNGNTNQPINTGYTQYTFIYNPSAGTKFASIGIHRSNFNTAAELHVDSCVVGDTRTASVPYGSFVAGQLAESIAGVTVNYNTSNDNNGTPITIPITGCKISSFKNKNANHSLKLNWIWLGYPASIDGFSLYIWSSGFNTNPEVDDPDISSDEDYVLSQTGVSKPVNGYSELTTSSVTPAIPLGVVETAATTGLVASSITAGSNTIAITTGTAATLKVGQRLVKTSGGGAFGSGSGLTINTTAIGNKLRVATIVSGGTKYSVGDVLNVPTNGTVVPPEVLTSATIIVTSTNGSAGVVTGIEILTEGLGFNSASSVGTTLNNAGVYITNITGNTLTTSVTHATTGSITFSSVRCITITTKQNPKYTRGSIIKILGVQTTNSQALVSNINTTSTTGSVAGTDYYVITGVPTNFTTTPYSYTFTKTAALINGVADNSKGKVYNCRYLHNVNNITTTYYYNAWAQPYRKVNTTISDNGIIIGEVRMMYNG